VDEDFQDGMDNDDDGRIERIPRQSVPKCSLLVATGVPGARPSCLHSANLLTSFARLM
jgi:hypothetical protein